ncbi:DNA-binding transcriptional regulator, MarR family [Quadrisphaera granulorum]|uniref:DNA-binding MarR family transcriptional regulator n=1 Tax=Quadrisphaera granulorum TaxID=317664 RepID=A0A315ZLC5_9ACTN|nr:MarR family winged helix-turn-helix transcriptional regulator [Quadrisphaera granulorum]PWJ46306.1 DNA-binding MarR family transcriptional regulator [Quadrisphaera granulorum]SZE99067.1 DNA-binding transcriptional regulator, MarR family [Quadrisphaera granulorum]
MATTPACSALLDTLPRLVRTKRSVLGHTRTAPVYALSAVATLGPCRVSEVAEALGLDLSTVSRQISHLRAEGLVEATPDAADGRSHRLTASPAGVAVLRAERRRMVDQLNERLADWDDSELAELIALVERLTDDLMTPQTATPAPAARTA